MESEQKMAVFSELLDNQKEIARTQKEIMVALQELNNRMDGIASSIKNQKLDIVPIDIKPIQQAVERGITDIRLSIHSQLQKPESNNWRVFMESDAKEWAVIFLIAFTSMTYVFCYLLIK
jgi:hypothetical protein